MTPPGTAIGTNMKFLDQAKVFARSGGGGDGCISFRREKYVEFGGPDGGDGGRGGHVYAECADGLNTLIDYRYQQHFKARRGDQGAGANRTGRGGEDIVLRVPKGTQVLEEDGETLIADFTRVGQKELLLEGGAGGLGNSHFKSSTNQAPRRSTPGGESREMWLWLRLKLIADAGIVGLPNAGKSTFLATVSAARPKTADYPFTTLHPHLGVVGGPGDAGEFVLADLPGLIEGAHEGTGLGDRFLGHVERCRVLLHLVDGTGGDIAGKYRTVRDELRHYGHGVSGKPEIVALSKCDALTAEDIEAGLAELAAAGARACPLSAVSGEGVADVLDALRREVVAAADDEDGARAAQSSGWRP